MSVSLLPYFRGTRTEGVLAHVEDQLRGIRWR
jgi:hypothetical protein